MLRLIVDVIEPHDPIDPDRDDDVHHGKIVVLWAEGHPMRKRTGAAPYTLTDAERRMLNEASAPAAALLRTLLDHREQGQRFIVTHEVPAPEPASSAAGSRRVLPWLIHRFWTGHRPRNQ